MVVPAAAVRDAPTIGILHAANGQPWPDEHEPVLPAGPPPAHAHPEKTVRREEASIRPAEYGQLMAQRHHLEEEVSTCGHRGEERRDRERVAHGR